MVISRGTVPNSRAVVLSAERRGTCLGSAQKEEAEEEGVVTASSVVKKVTCRVSAPRVALLQGQAEAVEQEEVAEGDAEVPLVAGGEVNSILDQTELTSTVQAQEQIRKSLLTRKCQRFRCDGKAKRL